VTAPASNQIKLACIDIDIESKNGWDASTLLGDDGESSCARPWLWFTLLSTPPQVYKFILS